MIRRSSLLVLVVLAVLAAVPALAAEPEDIAVELEFRNYAAEPGTSVDINALEELIVDVDAVGQGVYFVVLASDPTGGNDLFAARLLDLQLEGTVIVISPNEIGAASTVFEDAAVNDAVDSAYDKFLDRDDVGAFREFARDLPNSAQPATGSTAAVDEPVPASQSSGGGGGWFFLMFILLIVGGIGFMLWRNSRRDEAVAEGRVDEAQDELKGQLDVIANEILDLSDRVTVAENEVALAHFRAASDTFSEVTDAAETATALADLEALSDRLDRARWQLEAAEALIEGREVPPEPEDRPAHCFFDPAHRAGVEEAEIRTPAGSKMVSVCRECAAKLRKGETPTPRSINVGGRPVPAPRAPRSYGGGGLDWLGAFSIILGGRDRGTSYDFGSTRSANRSRGGVGSVLGRLGTRGSGTSPIGGTRSASRSTPRRTTTKRTSTRSTSTSTPAPKVKGRARRRR
ncbi:MAG: hypothetical protein P1T08_04210 [Acidimicrobiia bacterium]|nr:hypothetical protein [Acidimicrobiia bacterium]